MKLTDSQYASLLSLVPAQHRNVKIYKRQLLNTFQSVAANAFVRLKTMAIGKLFIMQIVKSRAHIIRNSMSAGTQSNVSSARSGFRCVFTRFEKLDFMFKALLLPVLTYFIL